MVITLIKVIGQMKHLISLSNQNNHFGLTKSNEMNRSNSPKLAWHHTRNRRGKGVKVIKNK